jgi:glycosyltransferase involved in cell wall biosynthesis
MARRLNILLSAYFCSPYRGGESAVGWQTAIGLAKHHDVTVICGDHSKGSPTAREIARYQEENGLPAGLKIAHVQARGLARGFYLLHQLPGLWFLYYEGYRRWQKQALEEAGRLHAGTPFDLAHQLTIITLREPGYLWRLGLPWFWGPINGAANMPWRFLFSFGVNGCYRHLSRNILNLVYTRFSRRSRIAASRAAKIWAVTLEDKDLVERIWNGHAETMIETGATPKAGVSPKRLAGTEPLKLAWCGNIEARKALYIALSAIAQLPEGHDVELHVIGMGPEWERCQRQTAALGLTSNVKWHGRVSHAESQALMGLCHLLVHTALKEGTPHVVLEAMSQGLPVICHDSCGMGIAVNESCGIRIPMYDPATSIEGFNNAILRFVVEPDLLEQLSRGALQRARELSWESHIDKICKAYRTVLDAPDRNPQS